MNITIENYNKLVPLMNELEENGIEVDDFHSKNQGYGFYAEAENGHYVAVHVWGDEIAVSLSRHIVDLDMMLLLIFYLHQLQCQL